jgi:adenosylcobinamide amidohydrolase
VAVIEPEPGRHGAEPALVWRFPTPRRVVASAATGGGLGLRHWIVNAQVARDYARTDIDAHLAEIAAANRCVGTGVGMLTAASVTRTRRHTDGEVTAFASVGLGHPTWAADRDGAMTVWMPGTINIVVFLSRPMTDDALVNTVITATEAKTQALVEQDVPGTGTASDALCVVAPVAGTRDRFGGPRSTVGSQLARAVHSAVRSGTVDRL